MTATVADIPAIREKLKVEIALVRRKAARWRAMGDKHPKARRSFHRSAAAMDDACDAAAKTQMTSSTAYELAIALDDMRSYVNAD